MSDYLNYYARNWGGRGGDELSWAGYSYLGPIPIPPIPTTIGMTDRNGTGVIWYLMWDGETHLQLTNEPPLPYSQIEGASFGDNVLAAQNATIYGPWDGPYFCNWRLGVTTANATNGLGQTLPTGVPRLQFDTPGDSYQGLGYTSDGPPWIAPDINQPAFSSFPEPTNFPSPLPPVVPGIPSSSPLPTGGGFTLFLADFATNQPPLILPVQVATGKTGNWLNIVNPWHLQHFGG